MLGCQPFFYDFGCQPLLCTCLLHTDLFIGVLIMLGLSCLTVNLDLFTGVLYVHAGCWVNHTS